jgi:hypothetical protein
MDGDWHNLGGASENAEEPVALQPLLWIDEYIGRGVGCGMALLAREGVTIMPEAKKHVWSGRHLFGFGSGHGTHPPACRCCYTPTP